MKRQIGAAVPGVLARILLTALGFVVIGAAVSCGSSTSSFQDASADRAQDGRAGGAGGGNLDGGSHDVAGESQAGGTGGANDAGTADTAGDLVPDTGDVIVDSGVDVAPETCGPGGQGCARLSVPLTDPQTGTFFAVTIPPTDLSGVSAVFRFCLVSSAVQGSGWVQPYAQEGISPYAGQYDAVPFASIPACPSFIDYTFNFSDAPDPNSDAGSPWFTRVQNLGLKIQSLDGASGSWASPTVVYVDSIVLSRRPPGAGATDDGGALADAGATDDGGNTSDGGVSDDGGAPPDDAAPVDASAPEPLPGPFTFDTSSFPFSVSTYMEVVGSQLDWVP
jgi:hypothetical protein